MTKFDLSKANEKLRSREKRTHQSVSRTQIESAKLAKQVSKLTAQIDQLRTDLKAASSNLVPVKPTPSKQIPAKGQLVSLVRRSAKQEATHDGGKSESYLRLKEKLRKNGTLKT
jgi:hypothetical protein